MQTKVKRLNKYRQFSEAFKRSIVSEFESGKYSVGELGRLYSISDKVIYRWIYKFSKFNKKGYRIVEMKASSSKKLKALEEKIKELERIVGQKQIMIDYYEQLLELAKQEYDIDLKKNSDTPPSAGSGKTDTK